MPFLGILNFMNKSITNTILFISLSLVLVSCDMCGKVLDCPGFDENAFKEWFPYKDKDELIYANQANLKDTFTLSASKPSEPYTSRIHSCNSGHLFLSKEKVNSNYKMKIELQILQIP